MVRQTVLVAKKVPVTYDQSKTIKLLSVATNGGLSYLNPSLDSYSSQK